MKLKPLFFLVMILFIGVGAAQEPLLINAYHRTTHSLNGNWKYIVDPYENGFYNYRLEAFEDQKDPGKNAFFTNSKPSNKSELVEYDFDLSDSILVPGDWNTQKEKLFYYEGTVWYKKSFDYRKTDATNRVFVYFEASNYQTDVYFNGTKLGRHVGGFTPFNYEVTHLLKDQDNFLVVKVDNKRIKEGVPTLNTDWWNYGGLTRDVKLIETGATFIKDYFLHLATENPKEINGFVQLDGAVSGEHPIRLRIPELSIDTTFITNKTGKANITLTSDKIVYWSLKDPKLYQLRFSSREDTLTDQIGFRTISTKDDDILLNGEPVFLKGISIHEESPIRGGRGNSVEDARQLLSWAKELGCNFVRLAHYPHNEHMVRLADEMGILVWKENPVYWTISWDNPDTYQNAANQLTELIARDKNRASVIIWSMANETPTSESRNLFLSNLAELARSLDPTRLISAALEQSAYQGDPNVRTIHDDFAEVVDVLSFNQYIGWYDGLPEKAQNISWVIEQNKPVLISEFGGGAKQGLHGDKYTRWTEEYQEYLYQETLKMLSSIKQLRGMSPWILVDFRSPRRMLPEIQDGWNRKGLISEEGKKKKAFFVLQDYYNSKD
ncbi:glycoside hydrolase family 2 protein [uncultured Muriicola sp.]|uniref:glycoside hydrolase family 2 protein n=1 Tax=uncultured Muriicola sp. TaxID=1583102 RepID=UPI002628FC63|nr:glycoside hydrolase family 2 TIM barrel-domain containing protein [uncultured Muriicola sp.]